MLFPIICTHKHAKNNIQAYFERNVPSLISTKFKFTWPLDTILFLIWDNFLSFLHLPVIKSIKWKNHWMKKYLSLSENYDSIFYQIYIFYWSCIDGYRVSNFIISESSEELISFVKDLLLFLCEWFTKELLSVVLSVP